MSYEGFREYICENGHYWTVDEGFFYSGGSDIGRLSGVAFYDVCAASRIML